jgi:murein DD-endopeptidase MepM/ murein hydrolase activator NlpD
MSESQSNPVQLRVASAARLAIIALFLFALGLSQASAAEKLVAIENEKSGGTTKFFVKNLQAADVTVTLVVELTNYKSAVELPRTITVPPKTRSELATISIINADADANWSYTYFATWGSLDVKHDETSIYALPYAPGQSFPVSQGFHGNYSHTGGDAFAIDFKMPEGSPVHAARDGIVVGAKDNSSVGGPDKKFEWDANYILIRHTDGTLGHYVHLQKGGNRVKIGQAVKTGEFIGRSGNTGHTTGPHLHFAVFKAASGKSRQTIPVRFNTGSLAQTLDEGKSYRAL